VPRARSEATSGGGLACCGGIIGTASLAHLISNPVRWFEDRISLRRLKPHPSTLITPCSLLSDRSSICRFSDTVWKGNDDREQRLKRNFRRLDQASTKISSIVVRDGLSLPSTDVRVSSP